MDLLTIFFLFAFGAVVFVIAQLLTILWLLKENARLGEEAERNAPPF